jgi:hypothetical protein
MSNLIANVIDTARVFRGKPFVGTLASNHSNICLLSKYLGFELSKREPKGRFFADKAMIQQTGGPWFIGSFKMFLEPRLHELRRLHLNVHLGNVEALDLFSYQNCAITLDFNHETRHNPIALQLVQKAQLLAIADEILEVRIKGLV